MMVIPGIKRWFLCLGLLLAMACPSLPASGKEKKEEHIPEKPERTIQMEYGPFVMTSLVREKPTGKPKKEKGSTADPEALVAASVDVVAYKGINIQLSGA